MHRSGHTLVLSATDLSNFLGCRHHTALDMAVAEGARPKPWVHNPLLEVLRARGLAHEKRYVDALRAEGRSIADLGAIESLADRAAATREAMRLGADVIVQGALADGTWQGLPDVMRRVESPSTFGAWSYEIADTKLARETRAGTILQLGLYSEMLAQAQRARPAHFHVVIPDTGASGRAIQTYRVDGYAAYVRFVRTRMLDAIPAGFERLAEAHYPEPVDHCAVCRWAANCARRRRDDDHLSLVAGISAAQRRELNAHSITTLTALAQLAVPFPFRVRRGSAATYGRVREQARLQLASRDRSPPLHELLPIESGKGFHRLPEPSPGDLFLDLEGDPLAVEGGREYLFGLASADGSYRSAWAENEREERQGFEWVMDTIQRGVDAHPEMHVYHYAPYEPSALKRLMGRYATRESELDAMLRAGRFVDLYAVARQALRAGVERYSIKNLEPLYAFTRDVDLAVAGRCRSAMEHALEMGIPDSVPAWVRDTVERYNRDDCISTLRLRDWLERLRAERIQDGAEIQRPPLAPPDTPAAVDERARAVNALRERLLDGVPASRDERGAAQQARWLLAFMLDYHRREQKTIWWEYFRLLALDDDELLDERHAVTGLEPDGCVETVLNKRTHNPTGAVVDRYRYPPQEMDIEPGDELRMQDGAMLGRVARVDRAARTIDIRKSRNVAGVHPRAVFEFSHVKTEAVEDALMRIAGAVAAGDGGYLAARALLERDPPRLRAGTLTPRAGETMSDAAVRVAQELDGTVLAIQGPPGSGKTFCGARMIAELVRRGKRVGVTATSHAVIRKLLLEAADAAAAAGVAIRLAHKNGDGDDDAHDDSHNDRIRRVADNAGARRALQANEADVVGGTAWLWARPEMASSVDVLFVDEAGQMALANAVAVSQAADSVVLLGDPRQLEQPRRGTHPDGVDVSALEHVLGAHQTIPADRGLFLPITWRLSPSICEFTSELFYDGRLASRAGLERQCVRGAAELPPHGLYFVSVEHDGNRSSSPEEIETVAELVGRLTAPGAMWIDGAGAEHPMTGADVLVVAPYNAQVARLSERLAGTGARVGTVDKFQGQEAPVAIYSMATSRPEDAPRGMEFLYSLNRLNVATSRARCLAIVVASPRLFGADCRSPRQMRLTNGLCRFHELAVEVGR